MNDQLIILAFVDGSNARWLLTALYASPIAKFRTELWYYLKVFESSITFPWLILGVLTKYLLVIIKQEERITISVQRPLCRILLNVVDSLILASQVWLLLGQILGKGSLISYRESTGVSATRLGTSHFKKLLSAICRELIRIITHCLCGNLLLTQKNKALGPSDFSLVCRSTQVLKTFWKGCGTLLRAQ